MVSRTLLTVVGLALATTPTAAWAGGGEAPHVEPNMPLGLVFLILGIAILGSTLSVVLNETMSLGRKVANFMGLAAVTIGVVFAMAQYGPQNIWTGFTQATIDLALYKFNHVFIYDYIVFVPVVISTVLMASMKLFDMKIPDGILIGWFLFAGVPLVGEFFTTWALIPVLASLVPVLAMRYETRWKYILVDAAMFGMNMLAVWFLSSDPPQGFYALMEAAKGNQIDFTFPLQQYWVYFLFTWALYGVALKRRGVKFGSIKNLFAIRPKSWGKFILGVAMAIIVAGSLAMLSGYTVTAVLGVTSALAAISMIPSFKVFGHEERHDSFHWVADSMAVFMAFFSVVLAAMICFELMPVSNEIMTIVTVIMTVCVDNAAAFAVSYGHFEPLAQQYMVWFALLPSIVFGAMMVTGNGPPIVLFLVILVSKGHFTAKEVFTIWIKEACVYGPYLIVWIASAMFNINVFGEFSILAQILTGFVAIAVALQMMDLQKTFRRYIDSGDAWDGHGVQMPETVSAHFMPADLYPLHVPELAVITDGEGISYMGLDVSNGDTLWQAPTGEQVAK